jgi:hypothetical protein
MRRRGDSCSTAREQWRTATVATGQARGHEMSYHKLQRRLLRLAPLTGLVLINGCIATAAGGLELLLAPSALANTIALPYSGLATLAVWLAQLAS